MGVGAGAEGVGVEMDEKKPNTARQSLTKEQLEAPEAIELLALLQTVTEDGRILDEEVAALNEWLSDNRDSAIAGIVYLRESVEAVLEDGRVTEKERAWLQAAIETVMAQEERSIAAMRRRGAEADDGTTEATAVGEEREQRNRPITRFDFLVAGARREGMAEVIKAHCKVEDDVFLLREPDSEVSRHTILVRLMNGVDIGYVPETDAVHLAHHLDEGVRQSASIKGLSGKKGRIPVIWGELYPHDSSVRHARAMSDAPGSGKATASGKVWPVLFVLAVLVAAIVLFL